MMDAKLTQLGFAVTRLENTTKSRMEDAIVAFEGNLSVRSTGLFYYAGHAIPVRRKNYLVPINAKMESERRARIEAVDIGLVTSAIEYSRSRMSFIILDVCRNNPFERSSRSESRELAAVYAATGTLIA